MASGSLDWERHKESMRVLYVDEGKTLKQAMDIMKEAPHHFSATKKQYERQFQKKWRLRKNLTKNDWRILHFKVSKRQSDGKRTEVFVDGRLQQTEKLEHEISRYGLAKLSPFQCEPGTPAGINLRTPTPASPAMPLVRRQRAIRSMGDPDDLVMMMSGDSEISWIASVDFDESDLMGILARTNELPCFSLSRLFDFHLKAPCDQLVLLGPVRLASFVAPPKATGKGQSYDQSMDVSRRNALMQAIMPQEAAAVISTVNGFSCTENPAVQFLMNAIYLLYNGLGSPELGPFLFQFFSLPGNHKILARLMSSPSIAIEAFSEELLLFLLYASNDQSAVALLEQGKVTPHPLYLTEASRTGCLRTVKLLLKEGVDPNFRPIARHPLFLSNPTALEAAVSSEDLSIVEELIAHGDDPNPPTRKEKPSECAFVNAIESGNTEILKCLLKSRTWQSSTNSINLGHSTFRLILAVEKGIIDMVDALLPYVDIDHHTPYGWSALAMAARQGHAKLVSFLLESGASPSRSGMAAAQNLGPSPLQAAIKAIELGNVCREDLSTIHLLLAHGADPNEAPQNKESLQEECFRLSGYWLESRTAIQAAAEIGHEELFFLLLAHGADVKVPAAEYHGLNALQATPRGQSEALWDFVSKSLSFVDSPLTTHGGNNSTH